MARSKKLMWSVVAAAILLLLALHRSQPADQKEMDTHRQPAIHRLSQPGFSAIPEPAIVDSDEVHPVVAKQVKPADDQIQRFVMSADGGEFETGQFPSETSGNLVLDGPVDFEEDMVDPVTQLSSADECNYVAEPANETLKPSNDLGEDTVASNPIMQSLQRNDGPIQEPSVSVQSVPDFEPAFTSVASGETIELPRGVLVKVVNHIEYGKSLARRGAVFGAKQEFIAALKLVAQSIDQMQGGDLYSGAFFDAIQAMRESDEFYTAQSEQLRRVDVVAIANNHQSKVVEPEYLKELNPMQAMQLYYDYVQKRLVACSGHTIVAGEALYCLGKLHQVQAKDPIEGSQIDIAKSVVFYNAAINCDPKSYKSANELGVLLARSGRLVEAKNLFLQSLKIHQLSKVWANLASVHQQLGENDLAQLADGEYRRMLAGPAANRIIWLEPESFAKNQNKPLPTRTADAMADNVKLPESEKSTGGLRNFMKKLF